MTRNFITHLSIVALVALVGPGATSVTMAQSPAQPAADPSKNSAPTPVPSENAPTESTKATSSIKAVIKSQTLHAPENLTVGQPLQLEIVLEHSPGTLVDMPHAFKNTRWDLIDSNQSETATESAITTTLSLNFAIFRPGQARLPAVALRVLAPDGTQKELYTDKVTVFVRSAIEPGKTPPFAPPRDPVAIWTSDYTLAWVGGFILGGALLGGLVVFAMRRRKLVADTQPIRSAHEVALEKLRTLEDGALLDQGEVMMYYVRMSEAIREYLGRRFDFPGTELTTAEINAELARLQSRWPRGIALEDVRRWLEHCDFVKFSGSAPATDAARSSLERAFGIVELTRRKSEIVIPQDKPEPQASPMETQENDPPETPSNIMEESTTISTAPHESDATPTTHTDSVESELQPHDSSENQHDSSHEEEDND